LFTQLLAIKPTMMLTLPLAAAPVWDWLAQTLIPARRRKRHPKLRPRTTRWRAASAN